MPGKLMARSNSRFLGSSMAGAEIPLASKLAMFEVFGHRVKKLNRKEKNIPSC